MSDHYTDVMASQITSVSIVYSNVCSGIDQRKHQSSASLTFVRGIHRGPVNSPHKWPVTRKMFTFHDVIMGLADIITEVCLNSLRPSDAYQHRRHRPLLVPIMACRLIGGKPLSEPMPAFCQVGPWEKVQ